jgi:hypothetical protein
MSASPIALVINTAGKLWKTFRINSETFTNAEIAAIQRLVCSRRELNPEDTAPEMPFASQEGLKACSGFLENLAAAAKIMGVPAAARNYRNSFTPNYRAIFPDSSRNYRVDILEGCLDQPASIWVNGDQFELSPGTIASANELRHRWTELGAVVDRWGHGPYHENVATPTRQEMAEAFQNFDHAWASLEHKYINELIRIEGRARLIVVEAIDREKKLADFEDTKRQTRGARSESKPQKEEAQKKLVQSIGHLNSVANFRGKGRDDLGTDILHAALAIDIKKQAGELKEPSAALVVAEDVIDSLCVVRHYLRGVGNCLECIDPHLCNNAGLVSRLVDWEESWVVGQRYLLNASLLSTLCDLVAFIQQAQLLEPRLKNMCEDCDVELFLVLPRLVILRFLIAPELQAELLQDLLPHRFECDSAHGTRAPGPELTQLAKRFARARHAQQIEECRRTSMSSALAATNADMVEWESFARAAVVGFKSQSVVVRNAVAIEMEEFMRELEQWSIEVQRHCAEDWNQCSAVLVRCLSEDMKSSKMREFDI